MVSVCRRQFKFAQVLILVFGKIETIVGKKTMMDWFFEIFVCCGHKANDMWRRILALTLSVLMTTQEAFVDRVDQDQTVQNVQSDL